MASRTSAPGKTRVRHPAAQARRLILDAAQRRLIEGGPEAVRVQTVAGDVGLTDAAVHYHFDNRAGLLEAVLKQAGRRLRDDLQQAVASWDPEELDIGELVDRLREMIQTNGYGRLTAWMALEGWKPRGAGLLRPLAESIHEKRTQLATTSGGSPPELDDTLFSVELLGLVMWADALSGEAWRRSVGLTDRGTGKRFIDWFSDLVEAHLLAAD